MDKEIGLAESLGLPKRSFGEFIKAREVATKLAMCRDSVTLTKQEVEDLLKPFPEFREFVEYSVI